MVDLRIYDVLLLTLGALDICSAMGPGLPFGSYSVADGRMRVKRDVLGFELEYTDVSMTAGLQMSMRPVRIDYNAYPAEIIPGLAVPFDLGGDARLWTYHNLLDAQLPVEVPRRLFGICVGNYAPLAFLVVENVWDSLIPFIPVMAPPPVAVGPAPGASAWGPHQGAASEPLPTTDNTRKRKASARPSPLRLLLNEVEGESPEATTSKKKKSPMMILPLPTGLAEGGYEAVMGSTPLSITIGELDSGRFSFAMEVVSRETGRRLAVRPVALLRESNNCMKLMDVDRKVKSDFSKLSDAVGVKLSPQELRICEDKGETVLHYDEEHFDQDWRGIRGLIAKDTVLLRERPCTLGSDEERKRRDAELISIREEVRDLCSETAQKLLVRGECSLAIPGALQGLKLAIELFGTNSTELVGSYLLLAECNLGLNKLKVAEEFLGLAKWIILKNPNSGDRSALVSAMQRNFGRLYVAQEKHSEALRSFAEDTYQTTCRFGPRDPRTAPCYYNMGRVFQAMNEALKAASFYTTVTSTYAQWLEKAIDAGAWLPESFRRPGGLYRTPTVDAGLSPYEWALVTGHKGGEMEVTDAGVEGGEQAEIPAKGGEDEVLLSPVQRQEAVDILKYILEYQEGTVDDAAEDLNTSTGREADAAAETRYVLALMLFYMEMDLPTAKEYIVAADEYFRDAVEGAGDTTPIHRVQEMRAKTGHYRVILFNVTCGRGEIEAAA
ncbi:zinc finger, MYND-type containing 12 [Perkinsus olseni]|uniref:Zinc finger, MYND-type containing 12 n=1 Tax=Perkinsus olseni TaxID=32597 RepID=A0A7J6RU52_PEROL|nr:zinc finger, MYND-type containing 12 [Perkinsus olseni]